MIAVVAARRKAQSTKKKKSKKKKRRTLFFFIVLKSAFNFLNAKKKKNFDSEKGVNGKEKKQQIALL